MSDQGALTLTRECRECGTAIPWDGGPGRPRVLCDGCRPAEWPSLRGSGINQSSGDRSPLPRHRVSDPDTSRAAAESVDPKPAETAILAEFDRFGMLNDDELCQQLPEFYPPTIRTARSRLAKAGVLVDSGTRRPSLRGRQMTVWKRAS